MFKFVAVVEDGAEVRSITLESPDAIDVTKEALISSGYEVISIKPWMQLV